MHLRNTLRAPFVAASGPERIDVVAKDVFLRMRYPGVGAHDRVGGDVHATEVGSTRGNKALEYEARGRVDTHCFILGVSWDSSIMT